MSQPFSFNSNFDSFKDKSKDSGSYPNTTTSSVNNHDYDSSNHDSNYSPRSSVVYLPGIQDEEHSSPPESPHRGTDQEGVDSNYKGFHNNRKSGNIIPPLQQPIKPRFRKKGSSLLGKLIYSTQRTSDSRNPSVSSSNTSANANTNANPNTRKSVSSTNSSGSGGKFKFRLSSITFDHNTPTSTLRAQRGSTTSFSKTRNSSGDSNSSGKHNTGFDIDINLSDLNGVLKTPPASGEGTDYLKPVHSTTAISPLRSWKAPDSWDVRAFTFDSPKEINEENSDSDSDSNSNSITISPTTAKTQLPVLYGSKNTLHVVPTSGKAKSNNSIIRVFREDNTFATILNSLDTTTTELLMSVQKKFFLDSTQNYRLSVHIGNYVKILEPFELPLKIQMGLLLLSGYTEADNLRMIGSEDLSYVCKFVVDVVYLRNLTHEEEVSLSKDYVNVDISGLDLKTIPIIFHQHTYEIESLNVADNPGIHIPLDFLQSCGYLSSLTFSRNGCSDFPVNIFEAKSLKYLDLEKNFLDEIPPKISHLRALKHLKLNSNQLNSLPKSFSKLENLETLNLSSNYFNSYPTPVSDLVNLRDLDLSYNDLSYLPKSLSNLKKLVKLNLCTNKLSKELPAFFGELSSLKRLDIRYNYISNIDVLGSLPNLEAVYASKNNISRFSDKMESFRLLNFDRNPITSLKFNNVLSRLTVLDLSKAKLTMIPPDFFNKISNIEKLVLDKNHLVELPDNLGNLLKLSYFSAFGNNIQSLPATIGNLHSLQYVDLHSNNLQTLPDEIWNLKVLTALNVSSNLLSSFPKPPLSLAKRISSSIVAQASSLIDSLVVLALADNRLNDDCFNSLSFLTQLKSLNLSYNDILEIPDGALRRMSKLTDLYLSGNELSALPGDDFEGIKSLRLLFLNHNKLVSLPAELSKLKNLQSLDVGSNQLKYNISNWPYDWSWHWNDKLKYLNFSGNKRFEIKQSHVKNPETGEYFDSLLVLKNLKVLGLIDVTLTTTAVPDQNTEMRVRTTASELDNVGYGVSDIMGARDYVSSRDLFIQKYRGNENEALFASFDGKGGPTSHGHRISSICKSLIGRHLSEELDKIKSDEEIPDAMRRTFLLLNKEINGILAAKKSGNSLATAQVRKDLADLTLAEDGSAGCSVTVIYIKDKKLYTANIGDTEALLSRDNGDHVMLTTKHDPTNRTEFERIRASGGYVSGDGTLDGDLYISRGAGFFSYLPHLHSGPDIKQLEIANGDDMIVLATKVFWDYISYELAVDIIRSEKEDPMLAAQKLRDFALSYGATDKMAVMVISLGDQKHLKQKYGSNGLYNNLGRENELFSNKKRRDRAQGPGDAALRMLDDEIEPPVGELAMVFTDIKNSTLLWDTYPVAMRSAIKIHNSIMRRQLRIIGGYEVKTEGDAFIVSFPSPTSALLWCFNVQQQLLTADWPVEILETDQCFEVTDNSGNIIYRGLSVRMGIHWGSPVCELDVVTRRMDYFGPIVNRTSRISALADGGQICISSDFLDEINTLFDLHKNIVDKKITINEGYQGNMVAGEIIEKEIKQLYEIGFVYYDIGERKLKGLEAPEHITLVYPKKLQIRFESFQKQTSAVADTSRLFGAIPIESIYGLRTISLRLERIILGLNGTHFMNEFQENSSNQLFDKSSSLFGDNEMLGLLNHVVVRIENCVGILHTRQQLSALDGSFNFKKSATANSVMSELSQIISEFKQLTGK
ncbi:adenylate cyclase [Yamadazyma tenuis ATCC 10573]|uniref:Adenylate cyclase n=1 Tax=Candida tenuis (strain ATCC 10573 / BCRC 21748 / CBS 615 / JCM 9827 / NBRC 10315 / NRRL Y-1498 / VKM Y-70) TaxID=590646 RepID=G3BBH8_CANTC|nr:adenylate cyclase [Yamadazyma tenuis ATCC 10573]EGV61541.1 adenylate cyclase [Yamadazyma tenuis ATCC 10573]